MGREPGLRGPCGAGRCGAAWVGGAARRAGTERGADRQFLRGSGGRLPGWVTPQLVASPPPPPGCHRPLTPRAAAGGRSAAAERRGAGAAHVGGSGLEGTGLPEPRGAGRWGGLHCPV